MKFSELHPLSLILFFASVIAFTILTMNPVLLLLSFFCALFSNVIIKHTNATWMYLILLLAISVTNPVFSHNGETVLFYMLGQRITLEAFIFGFFAGVRIVSTIYWFALFGTVFKQDKLNWLLGKMSPKLGVVFSMALRFIPLVKKNAKDIYNAQITMCTFDTSSLSGKLQLLCNVFSALVSLSIENAIETADTMRSRGFENKNRTAFSLFKFKKKDLFIISAIILLDLIVVYFLVSGFGEFYYYPSIRFATWNNACVIFYFLYALLCALPMINDLMEDLRWKYSISKI